MMNKFMLLILAVFTIVFAIDNQKLRTKLSVAEDSIKKTGLDLETIDRDLLQLVNKIEQVEISHNDFMEKQTKFDHNIMTSLGGHLTLPKKD